jgi:hypothetical protein
VPELMPDKCASSTYPKKTCSFFSEFIRLENTEAACLRHVAVMPLQDPTYPINFNNAGL